MRNVQFSPVRDVTVTWTVHTAPCSHESGKRNRFPPHQLCLLPPPTKLDQFRTEASLFETTKDSCLSLCTPNVTR